MTIENVAELVLNRTESMNFIHNMLHPDADVLQRGETFLSILDGIEVVFDNGEITADCPDISLPKDDDYLYQRRTTIVIRNDSALLVERNNSQGAFFGLFERERSSRNNPTDFFCEAPVNTADGDSISVKAA